VRELPHGCLWIARKISSMRAVEDYSRLDGPMSLRRELVKAMPNPPRKSLQNRVDRWRTACPKRQRLCRRHDRVLPDATRCVSALCWLSLSLARSLEIRHREQPLDLHIRRFRSKLHDSCDINDVLATFAMSRRQSRIVSIRRLDAIRS